MLKILQIKTNSQWYEAERQLRNEVLLRPIGLPDHAWEMKDEVAWHFIAIRENQLVGCVLLAPLDDKKEEAQLMQMAVANNLQGAGIGRQLVGNLIDFCQTNHIKKVMCHARANVVSFYEKLGFETYGEPFTEVGILHRKMRIRL